MLFLILTIYLILVIISSWVSFKYNFIIFTWENINRYSEDDTLSCRDILSGIGYSFLIGWVFIIIAAELYMIDRLQSFCRYVKKKL